MIFRRETYLTCELDEDNKKIVTSTVISTMQINQQTTN